MITKENLLKLVSEVIKLKDTIVVYTTNNYDEDYTIAFNDKRDCIVINTSYINNPSDTVTYTIKYYNIYGEKSFRSEGFDLTYSEWKPIKYELERIIANNHFEEAMQKYVYEDL